MARITTNTTGTQPVIEISWVGDSATAANVVTLPFVQEVTVTNSTGVYAYTTFSDIDTRKVSTPADNEISTTVVVDDLAFFGNASAGGAAAQGVLSLSQNKTPIDFKVFWSGKTAGNVDKGSTGTGFITSLAPTVSPEAPVWVTPLSIAVDGTLVTNDDL